MSPAACLLLAALSGPEVPGGAVPDLSAVERPVLDGVLDEPFWGEALVLRDFEQCVPVAHGTPTERTELLLAYDERNLYVGLRCYDRDPAGIRATQRSRDANLDPDDRVEMLFDTFGDKRNAFWFQLGAAGSLGDALLSRNGSNFNKPWDTIWYGEARITDEGWFGEIRIPFASINFDPEQETWGFNARRFVRRRTEEIRWAGAEPRLRFFSPATGGELTGFRGMKQGAGVDVVPYGLGAFTDRAAEEPDWSADWGLDVYWRLSPSTKLSLSYNTDFAETEVDSRQVNLTRFALFFPEKRKFFLEDSGVFTFNSSNGGRDPLPFFSRRIGLDADGNAVPLLANAKLTTSSDGYSLGLLDSWTDATADLESRNLFVGRYSKNFLEQSNAGVIVTRGDPTGSQDDYTAGVDLDLRTDDFLDDRSLRFRGYALGTEDHDGGGSDLAWSAQLEYPNDEVSVSAAYTYIGPDFDPALGFVRRTDISQWDGSFTYAPRLYSDIRRLRFAVAPSYTELTTGEPATQQISITPLGIDWESDDELRFGITPQRERVFEDFDITDDVTVPTGDYDFVRYNVYFESSDRRPLNCELSYTTGTFFDGRRDDYRAELVYRAGAAATLGAEYLRNDVRLEGGSFDVNIARARVDLFFSPWISWYNFVQWDDVSDEVGVNSRLRWILEPGRDLFVVLNQGWSTLGDEFSPVATDLRAKIVYTMRF
jgi:hypothetical protein